MKFVPSLACSTTYESCDTSEALLHCIITTIVCIVDSIQTVYTYSLLVCCVGPGEVQCTTCCWHNGTGCQE